MQKKCNIVIIFIYFFNIISAQKSNIGNWICLNGNHKISKKLNWVYEIQDNNYNLLGDLQQFQIRTGIGYNINKNNNVVLGYIFNDNETYKGEKSIHSKDESYYLQYVNKYVIKNILMQNRVRFEERFYPNDYIQSLRYQIGFNIPINKKKLTDKTVYATINNEISYNLSTKIFSRNRFLYGLGYIFNKNFKLEIGYMLQTLDRVSRNQTQITFINNLPFSKK